MLAQNPYIAGNPVGKTDAFVGRQDVLREVLRVLRNPSQNAITLYGQRRIGKTSVLQNLEISLPQEGSYHAVYFDLQDKASLPLDKLLIELATSISHRLSQPPPNLENDARIKFRNEFLPALLKSFPVETSLVLLLDEFDVLADPKAGQAASDFFPYLRDLIAINPLKLQFVFVLGRNITDLSSIALSLFKGVPSRRVSLLTRTDTEKLILLSHQNNTLNWSEESKSKVWSLSNGHPFLTQALCSSVWETAYESETDSIPQITSEHVEAAIPSALEASRNTLEWLWGGLGPAQRVVASALAAVGQKPVTNEELEKILRESGVRILVRELQDAPQLLQDWDIIEPVDGGYSFRVELLRRWLAEHKPLNRVQKEIDRIQPVAESLFQAANGYYESGDLSQSRSLLTQAIRLNPSHVRANELLAEILISEGNFVEARTLLESLMEFAPNAARGRLIQVYLAQARTSSDDKVKLELFERVLGLDSSHPEAQSAVQAINKLEQEEKDLAFRFIEGRQALQKGEWKRARESLHWVVATRSDYSYDSQFATDLLAEAVRAGKTPIPFWQIWIRNPQTIVFGLLILALVLIGSLTFGAGGKLVEYGQDSGQGPFGFLATSTLTPTLTPTLTLTPTITPTLTPTITPTLSAAQLIANSNLILIDASKSIVGDDDTISSALISKGYTPELSTTALLDTNLERYNIVIIIGASYTSPYSEAEANRIEEYVNNGGALILVSEDDAGDRPEYLDELGDRFGIEFFPGGSYASCLVSPEQNVLSNFSSITLEEAGSLQITSDWETICSADGNVILAARKLTLGKIVAISDYHIMFDVNYFNEGLVSQLVDWLVER